MLLLWLSISLWLYAEGCPGITYNFTLPQGSMLICSFIFLKINQVKDLRKRILVGETLGFFINNFSPIMDSQLIFKISVDSGPTLYLNWTNHYNFMLSHSLFNNFSSNEILHVFVLVKYYWAKNQLWKAFRHILCGPFNCFLFDL